MKFVKTAAKAFNYLMARVITCGLEYLLCAGLTYVASFGVHSAFHRGLDVPAVGLTVYATGLLFRYFTHHRSSKPAGMQVMAMPVQLPDGLLDSLGAAAKAAAEKPEAAGPYL